jgi:hypothetical protein
MASGALGTLASRPSRVPAAEPEAQAEAMRSSVATWLSALSLAGLGRPTGPSPDSERAATRVTRSWLRLVDDGRHPASWAAAAPLLRENVGPREWDAALRAVRVPLGRCLGRRLRSRAVVEGPTGVLRGPYVVIRFESAFERRSRVAETVTAVLGPDRCWHVAAYFID